MCALQARRGGAGRDEDGAWRVELSKFLAFAFPAHIQKDPRGLEREDAPAVAGFVERDTELCGHGPQRIPRDLAVAGGQRAAQEILRGLLARGGLSRRLLRPRGREGPRGGVGFDLKSGQVFQQADVRVAQVLHVRLHRQGEGEIAERRQAACESLRIGGDVRSQGHAQAGSRTGVA